MAYRDTNPNSKRMDNACFSFLESLQYNHKRTDYHMWPKYIAMGYAFVLGNTVDSTIHTKFEYLLSKYWIYPPGGLEGRKAANITMNWR